MLIKILAGKVTAFSIIFNPASKAARIVKALTTNITIIY